MARRIREDLDGVVQAYEVGSDGKPIGGAYQLGAGQSVPDGVHIPAYLLEPEAGVEDGGERPGMFDPSAKNIAEVNQYLDGVSNAERSRVLAAEAEGHARKGILTDGPYSEFAPAPTKGK